MNSVEPDNLFDLDGNLAQPILATGYDDVLGINCSTQFYSKEAIIRLTRSFLYRARM